MCLFVWHHISSEIPRPIWTKFCVSHKCWSSTPNKEYLREIITLTKDMWFFQHLLYKSILHIRCFHWSIKFFLHIMVQNFVQSISFHLCEGIGRLMNPASIEISLSCLHRNYTGHERQTKYKKIGNYHVSLPQRTVGH